MRDPFQDQFKVGEKKKRRKIHDVMKVLARAVCTWDRYDVKTPSTQLN